MRLIGVALSIILFFLVFSKTCVPARAQAIDENLLNESQITSFLGKIQELSLEANAYGPGSYKWILLNFKGTFPNVLKNRITEQFQQTYTVYLDKKDIPPDKIETSEGNFMGYKEGFALKLEIDGIDATSIKLKYLITFANLGAEGKYLKYLWIVDHWVVSEVYGEYQS